MKIYFKINIINYELLNYLKNINKIKILLNFCVIYYIKFNFIYEIYFIIFNLTF